MLMILLGSHREILEILPAAYRSVTYYQTRVSAGSMKCRWTELLKCLEEGDK